MSPPKTARRDSSRRGFMTLLGAASAIIAVGIRPGSGFAQGAKPGPALPHLSEADPTAKALGYVEDASKVDKTKFPSYKAGARCATCNFYQGPAGQPFGPCQIFAGKAVSANGWCASHSPKG